MKNMNGRKTTLSCSIAMAVAAPAAIADDVTDWGPWLAGAGTSTKPVVVHRTAAGRLVVVKNDGSNGDNNGKGPGGQSGVANNPKQNFRPGTTNTGSTTRLAKGDFRGFVAAEGRISDITTGGLNHSALDKPQVGGIGRLAIKLSDADPTTVPVNTTKDVVTTMSYSITNFSNLGGGALTVDAINPVPAVPVAPWQKITNNAQQSIHLSMKGAAAPAPIKIGGVATGGQITAGGGMGGTNFFTYGGALNEAPGWFGFNAPSTFTTGHGEPDGLEGRLNFLFIDRVVPGANGAEGAGRLNGSFVAGRPTAAATINGMSNLGAVNFIGRSHKGTKNIGMTVNFTNKTWTGSWTGGTGPNFDAGGTFSGSVLTGTIVQNFGNSVDGGVVDASFIGSTGADIIGATLMRGALTQSDRADTFHATSRPLAR